VIVAGLNGMAEGRVMGGPRLKTGLTASRKEKKSFQTYEI